MAKFHERLKELRNEKGWTQTELATFISVSKSSVNMYERGEREPNFEKLEAIADYFNVDMDYLMGKSQYKSKYHWSSSQKSKNTRKFTSEEIANYGIVEYQSQKIPLLGEIACGCPVLAVENPESYVEVGSDVKADFCLRAKGDSMIGARIFDGDLVFVRQQEMVENGEIAVVIIDDEATLKRMQYQKEAETMWLMPENPLYSPLCLVGEELNHVRILGKAISFHSTIR